MTEAKPVTYNRQFFVELVLGYRRSALKLADKLRRHGAPGLGAPWDLTDEELTERLWLGYQQCHASPTDVPGMSLSGYLALIKNQTIGRPRREWSALPVPFAPGTIFRAIWDCIQEDSRVYGFEDRLRDRLSELGLDKPPSSVTNRRIVSQGFTDYRLHQFRSKLHERGWLWRIEGEGRNARYKLCRQSDADR